MPAPDQLRPCPQVSTVSARLRRLQARLSVSARLMRVSAFKAWPRPRPKPPQTVRCSAPHGLAAAWPRLRVMHVACTSRVAGHTAATLSLGEVLLSASSWCCLVFGSAQPGPQTCGAAASPCTKVGGRSSPCPAGDATPSPLLQCLEQGAISIAGQARTTQPNLDLRHGETRRPSGDEVSLRWANLGFLSCVVTAAAQRSGLVKCSTSLSETGQE